MSQRSACEDLGREGQSAIITPKAAYTPLPKRAGFRAPYKKGKFLV
ncbi:acetyltransferase [Lacticaseibacillus rhamnosus]|nr:acetyltransferase [Lacticaseibacillus rhamnosus GG]AZZ24542.1 acetyltransferase [Lacticaseibacillus rhamnosus]MBB1165144.1 acetyltransferase [Lacticaseibacillus rhamnosus]MCT3191279.1 acetyltransferase [Lacticaseibacillus rhamnosus]MCT3373365.1 acetyltransferase [Lacticaseibacillus rhamnosus]